MNLHAMLPSRAEQMTPVRVVLIGAGKFGSMFLSQVPTTPGLHVAGLADLVGCIGPRRPASMSAGRPRWPDAADQWTDARENAGGGTFVSDDALGP